jgi:hypothetical protein
MTVHVNNHSDLNEPNRLRIVPLFFIAANFYLTFFLSEGNLRLAVMLPEGEDLNEWVAVNTVDFFNQVRLAQ